MNETSCQYPFGSLSIGLSNGIPTLEVEYKGHRWWKSPLYPTDYQARCHIPDTTGEYALHLMLPHGGTGLNLQLKSCLAGHGQLKAILNDPRLPGLEVQLTLQLWEEGIFTQKASIANGWQDTVTLLQADSLTFSLPCTPGCTITTFRGCWAGENQMQEQPLLPGNTLSIGSSTGLQNALTGTPGFLLSPGKQAQEESGDCILGALCWSGNYKLSFTHHVANHLFVGMGHGFPSAPYPLEPGQRIDLPQALLVFSRNGKGEASRRLHRYLRRHILPHGQETRRCLLNSWEGVHFDVHEPTLRRLMKQASDLGIELFVLDDGWFGQRADDHSSLGDWVPNAEKLPHGLKGLTDFAGEQHLSFGLWVEPEMVSPQSNLYHEHPDWAIHLPGLKPTEQRHQLTLNLALPEVEAFVLSTLARLLQSHPGISYIKWDCNRRISDAPNTKLYFDYTVAYYRIMHALRQAFPHVTFQCCSAGGGRLDLGAARFHEEFWLSDNTDPLDRLRMQWSASYFLPANAIGAHVTASPNLYTHRSSSLKFRFDVALAGRLGFELDPGKLSPEETEELKFRLATAKKLRPLVQLGELYRLVSPYESTDAALLYTDGARALALAYTSERRFTEQTLHLPLHGLNADLHYHIEELMPNAEGTHCQQHGMALSGCQLAQTGLELRWNAPLQSSVILLTPLP